MPKTRTFKFTDRALKGLPTPPEPDQLDYFDTAARGLGLRISYGGRRTFFCMYTSEGKRQRLGLGEFAPRRALGETASGGLSRHATQEGPEVGRATRADLGARRAAGPRRPARPRPD